MYGFIAITLFMVMYYRVFGAFSIVALASNVLLLVAALSLMQATLTLPGMAGIALTVGMAIDANVLINERIREELRKGNTPQACIAAGYERAFDTIFDSNVTTLIAGFALFMLGSGPVRGFAVVLCIGILTSMFSAVLVSRALVNQPTAVSASWLIWLSKGGYRCGIFQDQKDIPFMSYGRLTTSISLITFILAVLALGFKGLNLGVDFTGGTLVEVTYGQTANLDAVRAILEEQKLAESSVQNFGSSKDVLIRLPIKADISSAQLSEKVFAAIKAQDASAELRRVEFVGPQVGKELYESGTLALLLVAAGIMGYLALRFEWRFAVAAIIANMHDIVIILGMFAFFQWEFTLTVLAGILAILGYSVNESVVVFDRVRENFRKMRKAGVAR